MKLQCFNVVAGSRSLQSKCDHAHVLADLVLSRSLSQFWSIHIEPGVSGKEDFAKGSMPGAARPLGICGPVDSC